MSSSFHDHFSKQSTAYASYRPRYPEALYTHLRSLVPADATVWDCATGNGQAASDLARFFNRVIATDASANQIARAVPIPNVEFRVCTAESSGLQDASVDLVTVAQALHWFDFERFYAEVRRVLKPGGILAVWAYGIQSLEDPSLNALVTDFYDRVVGPYWPPERGFVEAGYRTIPFPFQELETPILAMQEQWTLDQLLGYFSSWSATQRFCETNGWDPISRLRDPLQTVWGKSDELRRVSWPLALRIGRH